RRRHTRFSRDWSSDVCSSDLFSFNATLIGNILVEAPGYESGVFEPADYRLAKALTLRKSSFQAGERDKVNIAFGSVKKADLVNSVSVLNPSQLRKYDNTQDRKSTRLNSSHVKISYAVF